MVDEKVALIDAVRTPYLPELLEKIRVIAPGGGVALLRCVAALVDMKLEGDQAVGVTIVKRALEEPIRQIVINGGPPLVFVVSLPYIIFVRRCTR